MNTFDFNTASKSEQEEILKEIDTVLEVAYKYGGYLKNHYLINVIVPRQIDPNCSVWFKFVNITFATTTEKADFVQIMLESGKCQTVFNNSARLNITKFGMSIARIACFIEDNDYWYEHGRIIYDKSGLRVVNSELTIDHLLQQIKDKKAKILKDKWYKIPDEDINEMDEFYFKQGWTICTPFGDSFIEHKSIESVKERKSIKEQLEKERKSKEIAATIDTITDALGKLKTLIN